MKLDKKYWIAIVCRFLVILTTFIITIFINRGLGVEKKGEYAYIINMVEMLYVIFSVGLGQTYATFKRSVGTGIQGTFVLLAYIHSALIIVLGSIYVWITRNNYGLIIVVLTALAVEKVIVSMIAVIEESIKRNIIYTVLNVIYLMVLAVLYFANLISLNIVLLCYAINDLLTIILYIKMYKMKPNIKYLSFDRLKSIYKMGIITMIVMLLISVNYHVDTLMLKWLSNSYYIGIYSVGVNFSNMFLLIPDSFKEVLFGDSTKKNFSKGTAIASIKVSLGASILILIGFLLFGKFAIRLFYGVDYIDSYQLTLILFIGCLFMTFFKILQPIYISHGSQTRVAVFLLCSAVANIVSNYFLIPKFDAVGAAVASAISYTICGVLFIMDYLKNFESDTQETGGGAKTMN